MAALQSSDFALRIKWQRNFRLFGTLIILLLASCDAFAQIQQAWVARYNNGITNGTNQAVKMALDSIGNIIVVGVSQNTKNQVGYVSIKYSPGGTQLWATRFDSTNYPNATPSSVAIDSSNNVIVTGSALTVKYDANGDQLWTAPYDGAAIAADPNGNFIVTGYGGGFNTAKLSATGSNIWSQSFTSIYGPTISQVLAVDGAGNVYVAGSDNYVCFSDGPSQDCYYEALLAKYDINGHEVFTNLIPTTSSYYAVQVAGMALDNGRNEYLVANISGPGGGFQTFCYSNDGAFVWMASPDNGIGPANGLALDANANVLLVGQNPYAFNSEANYIYYCTSFKLSSVGTPIWTNNYPQPPTGSSVATCVAIDSGGNSYVTGYWRSNFFSVN